VLFQLLVLTNYVRYLDIQRVLVELLALTIYVRYLDRPAPALCLGNTDSL
jgi:hypothetical protein